MVPAGEVAKVIPATAELPVVKPEVPPRKLLVVAFPMVLLMMANGEAIPETLIAKIPPETAAVTPEELNEPIKLF